MLPLLLVPVPGVLGDFAGLELEAPELGVLLEVLPVLAAPPDCSDAAYSSRESLPSWFLSSFAKSFSCALPFSSSFDRKPSWFLSSDLNAESLDFADDPLEAEPEDFGWLEAPPVAGAGDDGVVPMLLLVLVPELELPLVALSSAACADNATANAAAIAAAIRFFTCITPPYWIRKDLQTRLHSR